MIRLFSRKGAAHNLPDIRIGRVTTSPVPQAEMRNHVYFRKGSEPADLDERYLGVLYVQGSAIPVTKAATTEVGEELAYLGDGDVVRLTPTGRVTVLYRRDSNHNTILATERCNSLCLMCSQPPKAEDDSYRVHEILRTIDLIDQGCKELGISGGEPLLLGNAFFEVVERCKEKLPTTALHVLTNGRLFQGSDFAARLGVIHHHDIMLGIPLYSDVSDIHDYVVQAPGAFYETLDGLYNLAEAGVPIEVRVVIHKQTFRRLPQLADFIHRNLPFAAHVALMGLEMFGYTNVNFDDLWIDPVDYASLLRDATLRLSDSGMNVSIYNHQLCTIDRQLWPFARQSISDWKNIFVSECQGCHVKESCSGFFHSASKRHSAHIKPPPPPDPGLA